MLLLNMYQPIVVMEGILVFLPSKYDWCVIKTMNRISRWHTKIFSLENDGLVVVKIKSRPKYFSLIL